MLESTEKDRNSLKKTKCYESKNDENDSKMGLIYCFNVNFAIQIKKLSRWEVIDVVRTMSTQQAKQGQDATGSIIFSYFSCTSFS